MSQPFSSSWKFVLLLVALIAAAGGVWVAVVQRKEGVEKKRAGSEDIEISGKQLEKEFDDNAARAAANYEGRVLIVSGKASDIEKNCIHLSVDASRLMRCTFSNTTGLVEVNKGDVVRIRGICTGKGNLKDCTLLK